MSRRCSTLLRLVLTVVQPAALSAWVASPPPSALLSSSRAALGCRPSPLVSRSLAVSTRASQHGAAGAFPGLQRKAPRTGQRGRWTASAAPGGSAPALGSKLRGVLWDMDGTLSDSEAVHFKAYKSVFAKSFPDFEPNPMTKQHYADNMQGRTKTDVLLGLFPHYTDEQRAEVAGALEAEYEVLSKAELKPLKGLTRLLDRLDKGSVRHAIVTNAPKSEMMYSLNLLGVKERFSHLVPSEECSAGKPDPAPYLEGLRRLGLAAGEAIAIEDSPAGIRSATAAGLVTIGVMTTKTEGELLECGASMCIEDYEDGRLWECVAEWTGEGKRGGG